MPEDSLRSLYSEQAAFKKVEVMNMSIADAHVHNLDQIEGTTPLALLPFINRIVSWCACASIGYPISKRAATHFRQSCRNFARNIAELRLKYHLYSAHKSSSYLFMYRTEFIKRQLGQLFNKPSLRKP